MPNMVDVDALIEEEIIQVQEAVYLNFDGNDIYPNSYQNNQLIGKQNVIVTNIPQQIYGNANVSVVYINGGTANYGTYCDGNGLYGGELRTYFNSNSGTVYFPTNGSAYDNYYLVAW